MQDGSPIIEADKNINKSAWEGDESNGWFNTIFFFPPEALSRV